LDGIASFAEHAAVDGVAGTLERKNETVRHFRGTLAIRGRALCAVERAVDLDRGQVLGGIGEFARVRQALGVENPAPRLVGPAANPSVNIALSLRHSAVISVGYCVWQVAMRIVCRHNGHCDEATPDERAPSRVVVSFLRGSLHARWPRRDTKSKRPGISRASAFS